MNCEVWAVTAWGLHIDVNKKIYTNILPYIESWRNKNEQETLREIVSIRHFIYNFFCIKRIQRRNSLKIEIGPLVLLPRGYGTEAIRAKVRMKDEKRAEYCQRALKRTLFHVIAGWKSIKLTHLKGILQKEQEKNTNQWKI